MFRYCRHIIALCVFGVLASGGTVSAEDRVKGNLEVVSDLTAEVARELLKSFPASVSEKGLYIQTRTEDETYQLVRDMFTSVFTENGIPVFSNPRRLQAGDSISAAPIMPASPYRLEVRALEFSIRYPKIFRSHLIGGKRVVRSAKVKLSSTLLNPSDDSVVWVKEAGRSFDDQFPFHILSRVEEDLLTLTKPERNTTKWSRMVEPVVVSGIIVGLIYLFFSNQSGD
jgi:hypothetical protein